MPTRRGIVNGHWEPSEKHSRLLELVKTGIARLAKRAPSETDQAHPPVADGEPASQRRPIAAE